MSEDKVRTNRKGLRMTTTYERLVKQREQLVEEIREAFANVSREGGVSWHEADVIDGYGSESERLLARTLDVDSHWSQLVDDPAWDPNHTFGGFAFLDPIGVRYYLPALLIRSLFFDDFGFAGLKLTITHERHGGYREHQEGKFSLLNTKQRECVAAFLWHMATDAIRIRFREWAIDSSGPGADELQSIHGLQSMWWIGALESFWMDDLDRWLSRQRPSSRD